MSATSPEQWIDSPVVDRDGQKLGKVADVYLDRETGQPLWLLVQTGRFGKKETFVAVGGAVTQKDAIQVAYSTDQVEDAPRSIPTESCPSRRRLASTSTTAWPGRRRPQERDPTRAAPSRPGPLRPLVGATTP